MDLYHSFLAILCFVFFVLFQYDIVGHSGDSPEIPFVSHDAPPKNNKERLDVMKQMHAHAQYCWSGDHTLESTDLAITRITAEEADDYYVVVLSDANLERYGIPAEAFGKVLTSDPRVNAFAIFIGSLGNQADRYGVVKPLVVIKSKRQRNPPKGKKMATSAFTHTS